MKLKMQNSVDKGLIKFLYISLNKFLFTSICINLDREFQFSPNFHT